MKITQFDDLYPGLIGLGQTTLVYSSGSNNAEGDTSGGGDVVGDPGAYTVVGLRSTVSLASNIGGGTVGDVLTIVQTSPRLAMFATPSNSGGGDTTGQFVVGFDGGGSAITAGAQVDVVAPYDGTLTSWTMLADQSGSAVVDIWNDVYGNFPPTVLDTITASAKPTLSSATKNTDSTLTGWTTAVTAGDVLRFNLDSASTITRLVLVVAYSRP